jgi:hypothetical protein
MDILSPAWLCFMWLGLTAGIAFLETPVKFWAPGLTRPVALSVGSTVFSALNKVELVLWCVLACMIASNDASTNQLWLEFMLVSAILCVQTFSLLPQLTARAKLTLEGNEVPKSKAHLVYIGIELAKLFTLMRMGFYASP